MMNTEFFGKEDLNAVVLENVFANSNITVSHGIYLHRDINGIAFQGHEEHLDLLFQRLSVLLGKPRRAKFGKWTGLFWNEKKQWLSLYYSYDELSCFDDLFVLLATKLRLDVANVCRIKLCEKSLLTIVRKGRPILKTDIGLPKNLEENGEFVMPNIPWIIQPKSMIIH